MSRIDPRSILFGQSSLNERVIDERKVYPLSNGDSAVLRKHTGTIITPDRRASTDRFEQGALPSICGCIVLLPSNLAQCNTCGGLACIDRHHVVPCDVCRLWTCIRCSGPFEFEGRQLILCANCLHQARTSRFQRVIRWLFAEDQS
jgi:hypothetical protein